MGQIKRETIKFILPVDYQSITQKTIHGNLIVPMYINPENISISRGKITNESLTLGGYIVQFWGDKLDEFAISGTTGSGGIEAINILESVYKNEQIQFKKELLRRQSDLALDSQSVLSELASSANVSDGLLAAADLFFDGAITEVIESTNEVMEYLKNPTGSLYGNEVITLMPTLASFAVSVKMYFQGQMHTGFFKSFSVTEQSQSPGHFNYNFNFTSLESIGQRKNFMPWHRNPYDQTGKPRQSNSIFSENDIGLSFDFGTKSNIERTTSIVKQEQAGSKNSSQRSLTRFKDLK